MITLKLTKQEYKLVESMGNPYALEQPIEIDGKFVYVHNVDKFREFLNDEIAKLIDSGWGAIAWITLKSILSKLDDAK